MFDPYIYGLAESVVFIQGDDLDFRIVFLHIFKTSIRGSVIYNKNFIILVSLFF